MHPLLAVARRADRVADEEVGAGTLALVHIGRFGNPDNIREEASARFAGAVAVPDDGARLTL
jgi:ribonuclease BN (tRNA processing enzyme)